MPLALEEKDLLVSELTNPSRVRITISNTSALLKSTRVPLFYDIEWKFDNVKSTVVCASDLFINDLMLSELFINYT